MMQLCSIQVSTAYIQEKHLNFLELPRPNMPCKAFTSLRMWIIKKEFVRSTEKCIFQDIGGSRALDTA